HRARPRTPPRGGNARGSLRQRAGTRRLPRRGGEGMKNVLQAHDVHAFYGKSHILHGVSLEVNEGEIVTLLGRNGAGKTTTMRSLMGLTPPRTGSIRIFGRDTAGWPAHKIARLGVG